MEANMSTATTIYTCITEEDSPGYFRTSFLRWLWWRTEFVKYSINSYVACVYSLGKSLWSLFRKFQITGEQPWVGVHITTVFFFFFFFSWIGLVVAGIVSASRWPWLGRIESFPSGWWWGKILALMKVKNMLFSCQHKPVCPNCFSFLEFATFHWEHWKKNLTTSCFHDFPFLCNVVHSLPGPATRGVVHQFENLSELHHWAPFSFMKNFDRQNVCSRH